MKIDKKTYKVNNSNIYRSVNKKKQIILAGSLRKDNYHIIRYQHKEYGKTKKWCTYTISRDGKIYEHYDPKYYTDFMDDKEVDKYSISIVLENMGELLYDYDSDSYLSAVFFDKCDTDRVYEKKWKRFTYWENYTNEQFKSTIELCEYLCGKFNIELETIGYNVYYERTKDFNGIVTRSNYNVDNNDLNPSFNFDKFVDLVERGEE